MSGESEKLAEGTLISHLLELRDRLIRCLIAVAIAFAPCAYFQNPIYTFVAQPILDQLPKGATLIATNVVSPFMAPFKLSFVLGLFIAIPYVLWQIWAFVAPGLYKHEKKFAVPLIVSSIALFYLGVAFAYKFVFPVIFHYFISNTPEGVTATPDITAYLDFVLTMSVAFGVAFEVPIAVILLVITGIISLEKLKNARGYVLIGIFVVAAILTPPDAVSQCIMAIPMYLLYEGGMIGARIIMKMRREQQAREEANGPA
ncbi:MAG TPA: twin-arginine translocase subunit TatC [Steroidobacteraceae bacterium]|jgi:sec-independent protein translocase protein TatC|nr:twin-arginine translocase subunit TatC [Steroidobacteraceae bacterium]